MNYENTNDITDTESLEIVKNYLKQKNSINVIGTSIMKANENIEPVVETNETVVEPVVEANEAVTEPGIEIRRRNRQLDLAQNIFPKFSRIPFVHNIF